MVDGYRRRWRAAIHTGSVVSGALLLAACGGGVGTPGTNAPPVAMPTPAPIPAPPPTPTSSPPPTTADGAEYKASAAVVGARAAYAYDRGITGKGVTIAVIDTGIAVNGPEFAGRISPDSKAFENRIARCPICARETVTFALDDIQGHGTETASVALAAKNGSGMHGIAPDATLLALKISGPDLEGVATLTASRAIAGVLLSARATAATTKVQGGSELLRFTGPLVGSAFAVDAARRLAGGTATLGLSSPLRLERARATVQTPVAYDLMTGTLTTRTANIDLTPTARELDVELGWSTAFGPNRSLRLGIAHAVNAGHVAGVHDTAGFATLVLR